MWQRALKKQTQTACPAAQEVIQTILFVKIFDHSVGMSELSLLNGNI